MRLTSGRRVKFFRVDDSVRVPAWARALSDRDPKDLPFVQLLVTMRADAILSHDKDLLDLGGPVRDQEILRPLRDYARQV
jgi:predicted nucleic acid-binding protein